jgi:hypothetical protein
LKNRFKNPMVVDPDSVCGRVNVEANLARKFAPGRPKSDSRDGIPHADSISVHSCRVTKDSRSEKQRGVANLCGAARRETATGGRIDRFDGAGQAGVWACNECLMTNV